MVWGGVIYFMLLKVSVDTLKHFANRIIQLYEQGAEVGSVRADEDRIGEYVWHWCPSERRCRAGRWAKLGVGEWTDLAVTYIEKKCLQSKNK